MRADRRELAEVAATTEIGVVAERAKTSKDEVPMKPEADKFERTKLYEPPLLKIIDLRPEEAVLGACKSFNAGGHGEGNCAVIFCQNIGS
jgi:hypothetical protein